jgi:hypothetical protein
MFAVLLFLFIIPIAAFGSHLISTKIYNNLVRSGFRQATLVRVGTFIVSMGVILFSLFLLAIYNIELHR